jgi:hypothetical protein
MSSIGRAFEPLDGKPRRTDSRTSPGGALARSLMYRGRMTEGAGPDIAPIPTARKRSLRRTLELKLLRRVPRHLDSEKRSLVDFAFEGLRPRSIADLGGVWKVDAGYTFYALRRHAPERAYLVDAHLTDRVRERARRFPNLTLIEGPFGDPAVAARVGHVDALFLFDVLLHQAQPAWTQILETYAERTRAFVVFNPQWVGSADPVRLIDLPRSSFLRNTPSLGHYDYAYDHPQEPHPELGIPWRDAFSIWQWGITDECLIATMKRLGFSLARHRNCGQWGDLDHFEDRAFLFVKS